MCGEREDRQHFAGIATSLTVSPSFFNRANDVREIKLQARLSELRSLAAFEVGDHPVRHAGWALAVHCAERVTVPRQASADFPPARPPAWRFDRRQHVAFALSRDRQRMPGVQKVQ